MTKDELLEHLRRAGRVRCDQAVLIPLRGGVSSEIYLVEDSGRRFVVKRALARLRVRDDWQADTSRNAVEKDSPSTKGGLGVCS